MNAQGVTVMKIHDLSGEMEALDELGLQGIFEPEALAEFQSCAVALRDWQPSESQPMPELMHGLANMIIGAFSLHNHADMQRIAGKSGQPSAGVPFDIAQACLRKAVAVIEIAMTQAARNAAGPLSPGEAGTDEAYH